MRFDITNIDRNLLLKAAFAYSQPIGLGMEEYNTRKSWNENVDGLTDEECEFILYEFENSNMKSMRILDYHKGKPLKLDFIRRPNGQILVDTGGFDSRNGQYRLFEAILDTFLEDEIIITKKGYSAYTFASLTDNLKRPATHLAIFKEVLNNTNEDRNKYGKYWKIDTEKTYYISPVLKLFK